MVQSTYGTFARLNLSLNINSLIPKDGSVLWTTSSRAIFSPLEESIALSKYGQLMETTKECKSFKNFLSME